MIEFPNGGRLVQDVSELPVPGRIGSLFLDLETTSRDPKLKSLNPWFNCWIAGIAITWDDAPGSWYVPLDHSDGMCNLPRDSVRRWLTDIIADSYEWVNHHVKYDATVLANDLGVDVLAHDVRLVCTIVRAKIVDSDRIFKGGYGLDALSLSWLHEDIRPYETALQPYLDGNKDYGRIATDVCAEYACQDVITNRRLYHYENANLPEESTGVAETETRLTKILLDMEREGLYVQPKQLMISKFLCLKEMRDIELALREEVGYQFNPVANKDCYDVLCNHYGLPVLAWTNADDDDDDKQSNPSFDVHALQQYMNRVDAPRHVVEHILRYRSLSNLKGLFIESFEEFGIPFGNDGYAVMHPEHNQAVRTGRMSCKRPNSQQQNEESKSLILPGYGNSFMAADACLPAGTLIPTPYGDKPIEVVAYNLLPVLTVTEDCELKFSEISRGARIGFGPICEILFDDGSKFECTPDHGFDDIDGNRVNCRDLKEGDRLRHVVDHDYAYPEWYLEGRRYRKHVVCAKWAYDGEIDRAEQHIHHVDENKKNWAVSNLEVKDKFDHLSEHAKKRYETQDHEYRIDRLREAIASKRPYDLDQNPNWRGGKIMVRCEICGEPFERWPSQAGKYCSDECRSEGKSLSLVESWDGRRVKEDKACERCEEIFTGSPKRKFCSRDCALEHAREIKYNYRVVSVRHVRDDWFYSITVPETSKYVTTNGLVNSNSQIEYRTIAHYTQDPDVIDAYVRDPDVDFHQMVADMCGIDRDPGKTLNFAVAFGQGKRHTVELLASDRSVVKSILEQIEDLIRTGELFEQGRETAFRSLARQRGEAVYETYHETFPFIKTTSRQAAQVCRARGWVKNVVGRRRYLPQEHSHKAFNTLNQSSAADIIKQRMVDIYDALAGTPIKMLTQVHDELLFRGPTEVMEDKRTQCDIIAILEDVKFLRVPIRFKYGVSANNWAEAKGKLSIPVAEIDEARRLEHLR